MSKTFIALRTETYEAPSRSMQVTVSLRLVVMLSLKEYQACEFSLAISMNSE